MITEEELTICRKLPPHEWEKFGFVWYLDELFVVNWWEEGEGSISNETSIYVDSDRMERYATWLPQPHQIMELPQWNTCWVLQKWNNIWEIHDYSKTILTDEGLLVKQPTIISNGKTARLACLRAISPLLDGGEE